METLPLHFALPAFKVTWSEFVYRDGATGAWTLGLNVWELPFADPDGKADMLAQCRAHGFFLDEDPQDMARKCNTWRHGAMRRLHSHKVRVRPEDLMCLGNNVPSGVALELLIESLGLSAWVTRDVRWIQALVCIVQNAYADAPGTLLRPTVIAMHCWYCAAASRFQRLMCALDFYPIVKDYIQTLLKHGLLHTGDVPLFTEEMFVKYRAWDTNNRRRWVQALCL